MKSNTPDSGLSYLATPLELTQLAVQIYAASGLRKPLDQCLTSVVSLLLQSRIKLEQIAATEALRKASAQKETLLKGPLKIGKHLLPGFAKMPTRVGIGGRTLVTSLEDFEQIAVGLSKEADRKRWVRAFLKDRIKRRREVERSSAIDGNEKNILPVVTDDEIAKEAQETLSHWRKEGIQDAEEMALAYRAWRLTKDSPEKPVSPPHDLDECSKLASFASEEGKSELG